jgi:hypothetical protein
MDSSIIQSGLLRNARRMKATMCFAYFVSVPVLDPLEVIGILVAGYEEGPENKLVFLGEV